VWGAYLVADGEISIGALVASNILAGRVLAPLSSIAMTLARTQQSMTALRQLNKLMALDRDHGQYQDNTGTVKSAAFEFNKVTFSYPREETPAIDDLSISIDAGEQVGIIGRVGSGKSTFGKLLSGLYVPDSGNVLIDGTDTRHYNRSDLREAVLYCGQDADLFTGTVRDNILVGNSADDELFEKCASATGVSAFAQTHPLGYAMPVGERGQGLSGGQRQAVALARALIARPKILFLDEPTGSMDNHSEQLFIRGLKDWITDETTLIISTHRNSLLELISRLVVLENGKLAADGPKQQVLDALKKKSTQSAVVKTGNGNG
ncbi:MAG: ATP-binding cassette domain-containing protein, partial [Pseudomonadota bacterium]